MEKEKLLGNTTERAEIIIDYKKGDIDIKSIYDDNLYNRLKSAFGDWFSYMLCFFGFFLVITKVIFKEIMSSMVVIIITIIVYVIILSLHINRKFDRKVKKYFVKRSAKGERNRILIKSIKSKEFILWNISNNIVDFKASGDISKQLSKIWIKREKGIACFVNQADIKDIYLIKDDSIWNAHFIFDDIPKDGELYVEWI